MRKSKRVSFEADQKRLMELLKEYGIPMAGPDHPVYSTGPSIRLQPASPNIPDSEPERVPYDEQEEEEMSESAKDILKQILSQ
jgi:hypothetical protein